MGDTGAPFLLPYDELTEAPNGPLMSRELAEAVHSWLGSAVLCTSTTRPAPSSGRAMIIRESDTGAVLIWDGTAWVGIPGGGSVPGGGGGTGGGLVGTDGQWRASNGQSIGSGDTVVNFNTEETASPLVTRSTMGSGHKFKLSEGGIYALSATLRFEDGDSGRRFIEWRNSAQTQRHASHGMWVDDDETATMNCCVTKRLPAGHELILIASQSGQGSLSTVPSGTTIGPGFVRANIVKIAQ